MPYLHYLRNHVGKLMKLFYSLFRWGYGYFSTSAGEHLNKRIKCSEVEETNLDDNRFRNIIHSILSKQLYFTETIMPSSFTVTCSACHQEGHNRKNKSCPLHPSHPSIEFEESDNDD